MKIIIILILISSLGVVAGSFFLNDSVGEFGNFINDLVQRDWDRKVFRKTHSPVRIKSDKDGLTIISKIPKMAEKRRDYSLSRFKNNPDVKDSNMSLTTICENCGNCYGAHKYPPAPYQFNYYPTGTKFKIVEFVGLPDKTVVTMLKDPNGVLITANEYEISELVDGGEGLCQNQQFIALNHLVKGKKVISMKIDIAVHTLAYYQRNFLNRANWDSLPTLKLEMPKGKLDDYEQWLRFVVKGFTGSSPKLLKLSSVKKVEYKTIATAEMDVNSFVVLMKAQMIKPYSNEGKDFREEYKRKNLSLSNYQLGKKMTDILEGIKKEIPKPRKLSKKEYEDNLRIVKEEDKGNHQ